MKNLFIVIVCSASGRGIAQLVERLVRSELLPISLTFTHVLLHR